MSIKRHTCYYCNVMTYDPVRVPENYNIRKPWLDSLGLEYSKASSCISFFQERSGSFLYLTSTKSPFAFELTFLVRSISRFSKNILFQCISANSDRAMKPALLLKSFDNMSTNNIQIDLFWDISASQCMKPFKMTSS